MTRAKVALLRVWLHTLPPDSALWRCVARRRGELLRRMLSDDDARWLASDATSVIELQLAPSSHAPRG